VSIGTKVALVPLDGGEAWTVTILGAWDSNPDQHILSYQTALAAALLGKKRGTEAVIPGDAGERRVRIEKIEPALGDADFKTSPVTPLEVEIPGTLPATEESNS
jgi:transcription elongation GreA/GreB family factor